MKVARKQESDLYVLDKAVRNQEDSMEVSPKYTLAPKMALFRPLFSGRKAVQEVPGGVCGESRGDQP